MPTRRINAERSKGSVAVELAVALPLLVFLAVIGVDFARIFSRTIAMETAARNAAVYASEDRVTAQDSAKIEAVALKDLADISPAPTVTSKITTAADGNEYIKVKVEHRFETVTDFPGVNKRWDLVRTSYMRIRPVNPKPGTY